LDVPRPPREHARMSDQPSPTTTAVGQVAGVRSAGVYCGDQDRAKAFWTETMGFTALTDVPMGEGGERWIEVMPPDGSVKLVLFTPESQRDRVGTWSNLLFRCDDIHATYETLRGRGVAFPEEPREEFWGWWAMFADPDGNTYGLGVKD
jgi:lactoylglutathione lyase